ncbi:unnamed protein product [Thlaspi arvense]|uniref:Uncharacterized protein n=1 Tax=Thlaspi arvense TaxID=13288 RepID=A0AAU9R764_THLAR|nr:unnamed protein product [Thlaspi arvense]
MGEEEVKNTMCLLLLRH